MNYTQSFTQVSHWLVCVYINSRLHDRLIADLFTVHQISPVNLMNLQ